MGPKTPRNSSNLVRHPRNGRIFTKSPQFFKIFGAWGAKKCHISLFLFFPIFRCLRRRKWATLGKKVALFWPLPPPIRSLVLTIKNTFSVLYQMNIHSNFISWLKNKLFINPSYRTYIRDQIEGGQWAAANIGGARGCDYTLNVNSGGAKPQLAPPIMIS